MTDYTTRIKAMVEAAGTQRSGTLSGYIALAEEAPTLAARYLALSDVAREMADVMSKAQDSMCEGFCRDYPSSYFDDDMEIDCAVCRIRAALSRYRQHQEAGE